MYNKFERKNSIFFEGVKAMKIGIETEQIEFKKSTGELKEA